MLRDVKGEVKYDNLIWNNNMAGTFLQGILQEVLYKKALGAGVQSKRDQLSFAESHVGIDALLTSHSVDKT